MIITQTYAPSLAAPSAQNIGFISDAKLASLSTQCHSAHGAMIPAADNATQGKTVDTVAHLAVAIVHVTVHAAGPATTALGRGLVGAFTAAHHPVKTGAIQKDRTAHHPLTADTIQTIIAAHHPLTADAIQTTLVIKAICTPPIHVSAVNPANAAAPARAK